MCQPPVTVTSDVPPGLGGHMHIHSAKSIFIILDLFPNFFCLFEMVMEGINRTKCQEKSK